MKFDNYVIDEMIENARTAILYCNKRDNEYGVSACIGCKYRKLCSLLQDDLVTTLCILNDIAMYKEKEE